MHLRSDSGISAEHSPCTAKRQTELWQVFDVARSQWPELEVRFEDFSAHLDQLGHASELPTHLGALYLCAACSQGSELACKLLERRHFPALRNYVSRFDARPDVIEDLLQQVRYRLLVGPRPRIRSYRGQGSFDAWLREVARSVTLDSIRVDVGRVRRIRRLSQDATCREQIHAAPPLAPDEQLFRQSCSGIFAQAISRSLQTLPKDRRQLLHHYYVSGLSIDQLGSLYCVDRSTAARRIVRSVRSIQRTLRKELTQHSSALDVTDMRSWVPMLSRAWRGDLADWLAVDPRAAASG